MKTKKNQTSIKQQELEPREPKEMQYGSKIM